MRSSPLWTAAPCVAWLCVVSSLSAADVDLRSATIVTRAGDLPAAEKISPVILTEEMEKRTGVKWAVTQDWPGSAKAIIALTVKKTLPAWKDHIPSAALSADTLNRAEGFSIRVVTGGKDQPPTIFVTGADPRGLMFGVGKLLRSLEWARGDIRLASDFQADESPDVALRGHQLGFRARANSWDAWTPAQFDQYIRDLAIFGANAVENIPFEDSDPSKLMKVSRDEMNVIMSDLCARYDQAYWLWVPVLFTLPDAKQGAEFLKQQEELYSKCKRLDAIFVPGGDPGENEALPLMSYLKDMGEMVRKHHPQAQIWVSLQYFKPKDVDDFYNYLDEHKPDWFGGVVMGPSSPPLEITRARLPKKYHLRWYPDITHSVRCQYPVAWFDPALGLTLGRECVNPRPADFTGIYRDLYRFTNGFLTYSDGVHDDFNKNLWTALGWNPNRDVREITRDYARWFFRADLDDAGADALFALENNWRGSLADNGSVLGSLLQWQQLEQALPIGNGNWRFEMHLMRAYYDAYTRQRLISETSLEEAALAQLADAEKIGPEAALAKARETLNREEAKKTHKDWYEKIDALAVSLFESIGLQTSVPRFFGSGSERGCVMDFIDYPLNNRVWLEDQFAKIEKLNDQAAKLKGIKALHDWAVPPAGSLYDDIGHVGNSPRAPKLLDEPTNLRLSKELPGPTIRSVGPTPRAFRYAWHTYLNKPTAMVYTGLDPQARYTIRLFAQHDSPVQIDGTAAKMIRKGDIIEQNQEQEFEVPADALKDGRIELTWATTDETSMNWRNRHYISELWLIKHGK